MDKSGRILYRLNHNSESSLRMCSLILSHYTNSERLFFIQRDNNKAQQLQPTGSSIFNCDGGVVEAKVQFSVSSDEQLIQIFLRTPHNKELSLISGFPCSLAKLKRLSRVKRVCIYLIHGAVAKVNFPLVSSYDKPK
jgi:hypothetical protein